MKVADSSPKGYFKLKEFADDDINFDEKVWKVLKKGKRLKTLWKKEKLLVTSNFSFSHSVL